MLPSGIRFVLCCFRSTLITASLLLSFPAGTKMLQFPAFPIVSNELRHPWFNACMRLAMAFRSLPRPSSALEPSYPLNGLRILKPTGLPMQQSQLHDSALKDFVVRTQLARRTISLALDGTCSVLANLALLTHCMPTYSIQQYSDCVTVQKKLRTAPTKMHSTSSRQFG